MFCWTGWPNQCNYYYDEANAHWKFLLVGKFRGCPLYTKLFKAIKCFSYQCFKCSSFMTLCFPVIVVCCWMWSRKWWDNIWHPGKCTASSCWRVTWLPTCWTLTRYAYIGTEHIIYGLQFWPTASVFWISFDIKGILTFPSHGKFIEEITHEVSTTRCCSRCWETKIGSY